MDNSLNYNPFAPYTFNTEPLPVPLPPIYFQQPQQAQPIPYVYSGNLPLLNQSLPQFPPQPQQIRQLPLALQPVINSDDSLLSQDSGFNEASSNRKVDQDKRSLGGEFIGPKPSHPVILNTSNTSSSSSGNLDDLFSAVNAATNENVPIVKEKDNPIWSPMESAQLFNLIKNSIHRISKDWNWESVAKDLNIGRPAEQCQARWNRAGVVVRNSIRAKLEANFREDWIRKNVPFHQQPTNQISHHQYHPRSSLNQQPHYNQPQYKNPSVSSSRQSKGYNPYLPSGSGSGSSSSAASNVKPKRKYNKQPTTMISSMEEFGSGGGRPKRASAVKALKGFQVEVSSDSDDEMEIITARNSRATKSLGASNGGKGKGKGSKIPEGQISDDMNTEGGN